MSPFKSKAQERWMFSQHPEMAKKWAKDTPNQKALPEKAKSTHPELKKLQTMLKGGR